MIWEPVASSITATASKINIDASAIDDAVQTAIINYHTKALRCEELDKHVDELEEDIEYLDDVTKHLAEIDDQQIANLSAANIKINLLENELKCAKIQIAELQNQIATLKVAFQNYILKSQD